MNLDYLLELGYTPAEIKEYSISWNPNIIEFLAENQYRVSENMKFLQPDFDKDLLLKLPVFYDAAFVTSPERFRDSINLLKEQFPHDWSDIIEKQFYGYNGTGYADYTRFLEAVGSYDSSDIKKAINDLLNPASCRFEFMGMLKDEVGIELDADDLDENWFWDLEEYKYELINNAKMLKEEGMPLNIITDLIYYAPFNMTQFRRQLKEQLAAVFGDNYINKMIEMDEDDLIEIMCSKMI